MEHGRWLSDAPGQRGEGPEEDLEVGPGEGHPEPFGLLREQPGIADVAVEGRLEEDQEETDLVHLTAKPLAGEAVGELMDGGDGEDGQPGQEEDLEAVEVEEASADLTPVEERDAECDEDEGGGNPQEVGCEEEVELLDKALEQAIGIEGLEPQVQETPTHPSPRARPQPALGSILLQQP